MTDQTTQATGQRAVQDSAKNLRTDPALEAFLRPLLDKPWLKPGEPDGAAMAISEAEMRWRARRLVEQAEARIVAWLRYRASDHSQLNWCRIYWRMTADEIERGDHA